MVKRAGGALLSAIVLDTQSGRPISTQLYAALRDLLLAGAIPPMARLPSTRTLARDLGISRTTVIDAFERLRAEGLIDSKVGAGTVVAEVLGSQPPRRHAALEVDQRVRGEAGLSDTMGWAFRHFSPRPRLPHTQKAFVTALPAFDLFPMAQWARLCAKHWRDNRSDTMGYGDPFGHSRLRGAIAAHLRGSRGITCAAEQIFVVGGAQQAFHLIGTMLLNPGDKVWFENPGAIGARNSLLACGAELVPIAIDQHGMKVEDGLAQAPNFRLAFVTPSHQQPLGAIMSLDRRLALLRSAERAGAWIIEDDYDGEFFFGRRPLPTLKSIDQTGLVIYVGTFSKSLFPALRLGFMLVPPALVNAFETALSAYVHGVPTTVQAVVAEFIDEGYFASHIRRMRRAYLERRDALCAEAARHLRGQLDMVPTDSGIHMIGRLAGAIPEIAAAWLAQTEGVVVSPIARYSIAPTRHNGLVLGFGAVRPTEIRGAIQQLRGVFDTFGRGARSVRRARADRRPA